LKVAIPMFDSRVSPRFDLASKLMIVIIENGKVVDRKEHYLINLHPIRRTTLLCELGIKVLICGGISNFSERLLIGNGIDVIPMVQGEVEEVINLFLNGKLSSAIIPIILGRGYRYHRGKRGRCKGRGFMPR
jgi:predicted Fe-Mo cluster-binding NifX family protein